MCKNLYLIRKGILRSFVKEGSKEITTWISSEQELATCITCFGLQQPARENIQALEDCELSVLSMEDLQYLYEHFPESNIVGRKILEKYYCDAEERAFIARLMEATSKYKHFIATKSDLLNRVIRGAVDVAKVVGDSDVLEAGRAHMQLQVRRVCRA